jgi:hypothetical protein
MDKEIFDYMNQVIQDELAQDRIEVNKKLDKEYGKLEYSGSPEDDWAKQKMEAERQAKFDKEMREREEKRKLLHFPDGDYEEIKKRLEEEQARASIQHQEEEQKRKAQELQNQQKEDIRKQEEAQKQERILQDEQKKAAAQKQRE